MIAQFPSVIGWIDKMAEDITMRDRFEKYAVAELLVITLLSFPMFYYSYKYWTPKLGGSDFYSYYKLYYNWDFAGVPSPFNMRLISSGFVYLFSQIGPYIATRISFDDPGFSQHALFSALSLNYLFSVVTCWVIFHVLIRKYTDTFFCLAVALTYFFVHGTLFFSLSGLTDSLSIALFAAAIFLIQERSYYVLLVLAMLVLQRELVILFVTNICIFYGFRDRRQRKFYALVGFVSVICFAAYLLLRFTWFYTPHYAHQLQAVTSLGSTFHLSYPPGRYLSETIIDQNLLLLYVFIVLYKIAKKEAADWLFFLLILAMDAEIQLIAFSVPLTAIGRYISMLTPVIVIGLAAEIWPCLHGRGAQARAEKNPDPILLSH